MSLNGFFSLTTPADLLKKLQSDHRRVIDSPSDVYVAFDFCVTAWHLVDWLYPNTQDPARKELLERLPVLRVCEHLAIGAKHFSPNPARHKSVSSMADTNVWGHGVWGEGVWGAGVWEGELSVGLDGKAKQEYGASIKFSDLAKMVVQAWSVELNGIP
jgi:hypothetical protein